MSAVPGGYVVHERDAPAVRDEGDTAVVRLTIAGEAGSRRLEQRVYRFASGRSAPRDHPGVNEVLYVVSGHGTLHLDGEAHGLERDMGVYVKAGERFEIENPGPEDLVVLSVVAAAERTKDGPRRVTVRYADQPALPATPNREFRYLVNQDAGCADITQFVGVIPPGRAPMHSHTYDEVVYVIEGEGVVHFEGRDEQIGPGSCIHLPPLVMHSLENLGDRPMRVLGVFHPSGDPASRAAVASA